MWTQALLGGSPSEGNALVPPLPGICGSDWVSFSEHLLDHRWLRAIPTCRVLCLFFVLGWAGDQFFIIYIYIYNITNIYKCPKKHELVKKTNSTQVYLAKYYIYGEVPHMILC